MNNPLVKLIADLLNATVNDADVQVRSAALDAALLTVPLSTFSTIVEEASKDPMMRRAVLIAIAAQSISPALDASKPVAPVAVEAAKPEFNDPSKHPLAGVELLVVRGAYEIVPKGAVLMVTSVQLGTGSSNRVTASVSGSGLEGRSFTFNVTDYYIEKLLTTSKGDGSAVFVEADSGSRPKSATLRVTRN